MVTQSWSGVFFRCTVWDLWCVYQLPSMHIEMLEDHPHPFMILCYPQGSGVFQQYNCTSRKSRLATGWLDEHSSDFSVKNWSPRRLDINSIEPLWDVWEQCEKGHHTAPTNFSELWTALANI
ncbi:transposable element Tcb2 transposase [Trichonephila clavipes]|nr:transposable element Tcb2 transposase [Trichonephila clavipes]